jgi:hypothetical protein
MPVDVVRATEWSNKTCQELEGKKSFLNNFIDGIKYIGKIKLESCCF